MSKQTMVKKFSPLVSKTGSKPRHYDTINISNTTRLLPQDNVVCEHGCTIHVVVAYENPCENSAAIDDMPAHFTEAV